MKLRIALTLALLLTLSGISMSQEEAGGWQTLETIGTPTARHEAAFVGFEGKMYLMGGRRINPVDVFDPRTKSWSENAFTPFEVHHFQGVVLGKTMYLMGAMTGKFPRETPLEKVLVYFPEEDRFDVRHAIPESRRRGGAGAALYNNKIYLVGGITNGHMDGSQSWFDEYDPETGNWRAMADAPHARDHFQAVVIGDRLYAAGGRRTSKATNQLFDLTEDVVDIFDFKQGKWLPGDQCPKIPTPRAGNSCVVVDEKLVVGGGETANKQTAHNQVEVYDPKTKAWDTWPSFQRGRHGSGLVFIENALYTASGSGNRGGSPELNSTEKLLIPSATLTQ